MHSLISPGEITECISSTVDDVGALDLAKLLGRKKSATERSRYEDAS